LTVNSTFVENFKITCLNLFFPLSFLFLYDQCCGAGAGAARSPNFWPELEPVLKFRLWFPAPAQTKLVY
jgi:hypothetical protein